jgi:hypothetical protein
MNTYKNWRKSSYSTSGNDCLEVAHVPSRSAVRDSKNPDGPRLEFPRAAFLSFVAMAKQ